MHDTVAEHLNEEQLKALLAAAQTLGINPNEMRAENPWKFKGPRAESIQAAIAQNNPGLAAKWRLDAGEKLSLGALAARDGITVMTNAQHQELLNLDPDYAAGAQEAKSRLEADLLAKMEASADQLAATREKQQQDFARSAGSNAAGGQYTQQFMRRIGGPEGLKRRADRFIGGN